VPVVQTLHNYRLLCPAATFVRDGRICEDCATPIAPVSAIAHKCYRNSYLQTAAAAASLTVHRLAKTYRQRIDVLVALTGFTRDKFLQAGFPSSRLVVKPNFVSGEIHPAIDPGTYVLFVGRLVPEKGLRILLDAWRQLPKSIPLYIVGE